MIEPPSEPDDSPAQHARDRLLSDARICVVGAPTGYGKTRLLARWKRTLEPVAYIVHLGLTERHNDPGQLLADISANSREALPSLTWHLELPPFSDVLNQLFDAIHERVNRPLVFMLDDLHRITSPEMLHAIEHTLRMAPDHVRTVFAGRGRSPFLLAHAVATGTAQVITADDLALDIPAIARITGRSPGVADADPGQVFETTDGWPVAVDALVARPPQAPALISDLVEYELLPTFSATTGLLLEETSFLSEITAPRVDALLGDGVSTAFLHELSERHTCAFAGSVPPDRWRLPRVVRETLQRRLRHRSPARSRELQTRAGNLYGFAVPLTAREIDILARLRSDRTFAQLAREMHVSYHTVKAHIRSIYAKLGVNSRVAAIEKATHAGLAIRPPAFKAGLPGAGPGPEDVPAGTVNGERRGIEIQFDH